MSSGYGTNTGAVSTGHVGGDEEQPLLRNRNGNSSSNGSPTTKSIRRKLTVEIQRDWADLVLLLCYIITGLLDSSSISIWGSFVSMQTGRLLCLCLYLHT
jgi:hypothetical protein